MPGAVKASHHPSSVLCFEEDHTEIASMTRVLVSGKKQGKQDNLDDWERLASVG